MSAVVTSLPTSALDALFAALAKVLGVTPAEVRPWLWPAAIEAGDYVLAAEDLDDVRDRLDELLEVRQLLPSSVVTNTTGKQKFERVIKSVEEVVAGLRSSLDGNRERLRPILGDTAVAKWAEGWVSLALIFEAMLRILKSANVDELSEAMARERQSAHPRSDRPWTQFLYDDNLPVVLRRAVWDALVGLVALMPIQRAFEQKKPIERWLALALVEHFAKGVGGLLPAVVASVTAGAPYALQRTTLEIWGREAVASVGAVYYPLGDGERG